MNFVAIDVETANPDMGSICQIGIAVFSGGCLVDEWSALVDPEAYFDNVNVSIHGIAPHMVKGQPSLPKVADKLRGLMANTVTVCHTHFDRLAIARAFAKYKLEPITTTWLDSARVVRRTWQDLAWSGYGLSNVCKKIGYEFKHHDALEDAKAAGYVLLAACQESQSNLEDWTRRVDLPIKSKRAPSVPAIHRAANPEGDLFGEVIVFTGALELPRPEAADLAACLGCEVGLTVTKKTTILVIGDQDVSKLAGFEKSTKHRKAEQMVADGKTIRIIFEADFKALARSTQGSVTSTVDS